MGANILISVALCAVAVVLILGLVTGWMLPVLAVLAVFTNITAVQRIYDVYRKTNSG